VLPFDDDEELYLAGLFLYFFSKKNLTVSHLAHHPYAYFCNFYYRIIFILVRFLCALLYMTLNTQKL